MINVEKRKIEKNILTYNQTARIKKKYRIIRIITTIIFIKILSMHLKYFKNLLFKYNNI